VSKSDRGKEKKKEHEPLLQMCVLSLIGEKENACRYSLNPEQVGGGGGEEKEKKEPLNIPKS